MTKFFVLTGFLGSGKTTLLRSFLATPEAADTGVIVNEVGEIGLDGAILAEGAGGLPVAQLANGCVCCSLGSDLEFTVDALIASRSDAPLRRIVLETSGISKPGPILRALSGLAAHRLGLEVVCTFDCTRGEAIAGFEEAAAQLSGAHTVVLTKRDAAGAMDEPRARRTVAGFNPIAGVVVAPSRHDAALAAFSLERQGGFFPTGGFRCDDGAAHPRIRAIAAEQDAPVAWEHVAAWFDNLAGRLGDRLLRTKGLLEIAGMPRRVLVESVGTTFAQPRLFGRDSDGSGFLVLVGRDIDTAMLQEVEPAVPLRFGGSPQPR
ncbi:MAG TPA: GTP-binding protein [Acetobacteraceae bacterium]|nr:GTP-binding protein [Acetobacteraceae bacterium]